MKKFKLKSFCKINLLLNVVKKLNNGYNEIESLITFCNLYDVIYIKEIDNYKDQISFSGKFKNNINLKSNTVTEVLRQLRKRRFLKNRSFRINVKKNIPHGSGLGGGSSNAATLLNFFKSKIKLKISKIDMIEIANKIGSDVLVNLERKNTLVAGRGERMLRIENKFKLNVLIVYPNVFCSTEKIYKKNKNFSLSKLKFGHFKKKKNELIILLKKQNNDLEKIVTKMYPRVRKLINFVKIQKGCYFSRITGSGSACIGIFSNKRRAIYTQKLIKLKFPKYWCVVSKTI